MKKITFTFIAVAICGTASFGITINVPEDYATIGEAISVAVDGDTIIVGPGVYDPPPTVFYEPDDITLLGNGFVGANRTTIVGNFTTEIEAKIDIRYVDGWEIGGFELIAGHKGINTEGNYDCYIHDIYVHDVTWNYADGVMVNATKVLVERSIFVGCPYAGIEIWYPTQSGHIFRNNTIIDCNNGVLVRGQTEDLVLENNIIMSNGDGVEFVGTWTGSEFLDYNDLFDNGDNWSGCVPGSHNIYANPLFVGGAGAEQYLLLPDSPCIDAGDPDSPPDPDGTVADIGCFYFDQNFPPGSLTLDLEPVDPPIILPPQGGAFDYTASLACDPSNYAIFDAWTELLLPDGQTMGPLYIRPNVFLAAGDSLFRQLEMYVSAWAMPGTYEFRGYLGPSLDSVWAADFFTFEKLPLEGGATPAEDPYVVISGWDLVEKIYLIPATNPPRSPLEISGTPNPFNPETTLRFNLPQAGQATLKVYDLAGRTVATLFDRELPTGWHTAQFDGSQAASGVYLAVLESGGGRIVERLLLLK